MTLTHTITRRARTSRLARLAGVLPTLLLLAHADRPAPPAKRRPLTFNLETSVNGHDFVRIRAAGNREVLLTSQIYVDEGSARHAVDLVVEAVLKGDFEIVDNRRPS